MIVYFTVEKMNMDNQKTVAFLFIESFPEKNAAVVSGNLL